MPSLSFGCFREELLTFFKESKFSIEVWLVTVVDDELFNNDSVDFTVPEICIIVYNNCLLFSLMELVLSFISLTHVLISPHCCEDSIDVK